MDHDGHRHKARSDLYDVRHYPEERVLPDRGSQVAAGCSRLSFSVRSRLKFHVVVEPTQMYGGFDGLSMKVTKESNRATTRALDGRQPVVGTRDLRGEQPVVIAVVHRQSRHAKRIAPQAARPIIVVTPTS